MKSFNNLIKNITKKLLYESPFHVGEKQLYIDLNDTKANENELKRATLNNLDKIDEFEKYDVFRSTNKQTLHNTFYFIDKVLIEALVEVFNKDGVGYSKTIAKRNVPKNKNLIQDIFLSYFPTLYNSIVSDEYMNSLGKNFWKKLLDLSLAKNYSVKLLISNTGEEKDYDPEKFETYWNNKSDSMIRRPSPTRILFKIYYK